MRTYTEIIGFDLGHAETAIMQTQKDVTTQPKHLKVNGESPVITAVAERDGRTSGGRGECCHKRESEECQGHV